MRDLVESCFSNGGLIFITLGKKGVKIRIRPLEISGKQHFQFTTEKNTQAFHENFDEIGAKRRFLEIVNEFKEVHFFTKKADIHAIFTKSNEWKLLYKPPSKTITETSHNRKKTYLIDEDAPFWQPLGIAKKGGGIRDDARDKFLQVNRFIEILHHVVLELPEKKELTIFDFGCGKGYLTFAAYYYIKEHLKKQIRVYGVDLKQDVIANLDRLKNTLHFDALSFTCQDIQSSEVPDGVDLVLSLHACDTATDVLLKKAVMANAKAILAVPCCHKAFRKVLKAESLEPLLQFGILKEKFASLSTDAARALWLKTKGYRVDILEFIDPEHTPKNLMIRALKGAKPTSSSIDEYKAFIEYLNFPSFDDK